MLDDHANSAPVIGCPSSPVTDATSRSVSPGASVASAGVTDTPPDIHATTTSAEPDAPPTAAVTTVRPRPTAVTRPAESTVATNASPLDHRSTTAPGSGSPHWSSTRAVRRTVRPTASNSTAPGTTATADGTGSSTVSRTVSDTPSAVALTDAPPAPTAVASPDPSTRTTDAWLDAHKNSAASMWNPFASTARAANWSVSPSRSVSADAVTATSLTTCSTVNSA